MTTSLTKHHDHPVSQSLVQATSDEEVIRLYLSQMDDQGQPRFSERTLESYRRDIKRLLVFMEGRPLSTITLEQVYQFIAWLKQPDPSFIDHHCRRPLNHPEWKPFYQKGLTPSALRQQLASIKAFYRWLNDTGYLKQNPFGLIKSAIPASQNRPKRQLYKEDLQAVAKFLTVTEPTLQGKPLIKLARQRWLWFGYLLSGLRISELINHTTGEIYSEIVQGEKVWMMAIVGKGRREPEPHPIPDAFMSELWRYRKAMGLEPWPQIPAPLVYNLTATNPIASRSTAHKVFKGLIQQVAQQQASAGLHDSSARLLSASTHWLRHSFVTTLLDITSDIPAVSNLARHRDIKTTIGYDHSELVSLKGLLNNYADHVHV